ncbi:hypothetical protein ACFFQW_37715 [Umezawaea endophytica]|uniref:Uncharacterized protein n=1 Tax=Umezawaea endophytica TaxID=1654476 RepID=A0A9X2VW12_9PSEU|nr:hypothetical protein [Umezawaea endophytica]MCS7483232.1 hypothetical protein [Umezawaea endophytica]
MPDPKDPQGPTPEPTARPPRAEQPTTPLPATGSPAPQPTAEQPAPQPTVEQPAAPQPTAEQPTPPPAPEAAPQQPVTTASAAEAPPGPPPAAAPVYATAPRRGFRQVAAHRATQLVAVGVLGLIIGGGLVALLDRDGYRGGHGRPGISRMDDRGPGPRGDHGPRWDDHGRFER